MKARSLQSFTAGRNPSLLACGYSWLPRGSAPCTQLRISCIMSIGKYMKRGERESLLLQLDMHLENCRFQLISHFEPQGHSIPDRDPEPDFRICSQLCDLNINLAIGMSIITKCKNCIIGKIQNCSFPYISYSLSFFESDFLRYVQSWVWADLYTH